ncbi:hypothetical protein CCS01_31785 [Rhodopila globiformis]|uniref:GxxExxY protein n=2 Tax=Rhodopila globiformis TaxID=1071 RepID=A0A2S6MTS0_RHOGL|nr:hypothetical protein CCS01_31785 [Rhodopila globiformis]
MTSRVIGLAIDVHRTIGLGLLGSAYAARLCDELAQAGIPFQREAGLPVMYQGQPLSLGFRAGILVADAGVRSQGIGLH